QFARNFRDPNSKSDESRCDAPRRPLREGKIAFLRLRIVLARDRSGSAAWSQDLGVRQRPAPGEGIGVLLRSNMRERKPQPAGAGARKLRTCATSQRRGKNR